jgi:hypothetical protein
MAAQAAIHASFAGSTHRVSWMPASAGMTLAPDAGRPAAFERGRCYVDRMTAQSKPRMTVAEFLAWAAAQPRGRYGLVRGEVVAMAPERARHNLMKLAVTRSPMPSSAPACPALSSPTA